MSLKTVFVPIVRATRASPHFPAGNFSFPIEMSQRADICRKCIVESSGTISGRRIVFQQILLIHCLSTDEVSRFGTESRRQ
ncbi:unnamed protein product [Tenebrio molitor]|nr:unnamed protein product [Tenebrio molitor]